MDRNHLQVPACRDVIADSQILFFMSPHFDHLLDMTDGRLEHNVTVGSTVHVPSSTSSTIPHTFDFMAIISNLPLFRENRLYTIEHEFQSRFF